MAARLIILLQRARARENGPNRESFFLYILYAPDNTTLGIARSVFILGRRSFSARGAPRRTDRPEASAFISRLFSSAVNQSARVDSLTPVAGCWNAREMRLLYLRAHIITRVFPDAYLFLSLSSSFPSLSLETRVRSFIERERVENYIDIFEEIFFDTHYVEEWRSSGIFERDFRREFVAKDSRFSRVILLRDGFRKVGGPSYVSPAIVSIKIFPLALYPG